MKFLCGNCKAKYQIADAKVAGRTLRMKCRRCGHDILIQGEGGGGGASRGVGGSTVSMPPSPSRGGAAKRPPPVPPPAPSALGAGFRRGLSGPPEVPQRPAAHDQWHVAIHDVPVGPMSREELARKISAGAAGPQSLCWREGMDDWRPLEDVPDLAALLTRGGSRQGLRPVPAAGRVAGPPQPPDDYDDEFGEPTRVADASHLRGPASSSQPVAMPPVGPMGASPTPPPSVAPEPSHPAAAAGGRPQMSPWALIGIGMAIAMGLLGGPFIIMRLLETSPGQAGQATATATAPTQPAPVEEPQQAQPQVDLLDLEEPAEEPEEEPEEGPEAAKTATKSPAKPARKTPASSGKQLTEEQRKLLERMGGGGAAPGNIRGSGGGGGGGSAGGKSLNADQLRSVVKRNQPGLQRCYETAMRATSSSDTLRINVSLTVGMSGTVTKVNASGGSMAGLNTCIEKLVKRWRFPSSSGPTEFAFPVLFQPGM